MQNNIPTMQDIIWVKVDGDRLISAYGQSQGQPIGYTVKAYEEAISIAEEYRKILEENGLIEVEKTPEEVLNGKMDLILETVKGMESRLTKIEEVQRGYRQNHPDGIKADRARPKQAE